MSPVQGAFYKGYTDRGGENRGPMTERWLRRAAPLAVIIVVATVLVPWGGAATAAGPSLSGTPAAGHPFGYTSYPSGGVRVVFPTAHPEVYLVDAQNGSLGAGLAVDGILELAAGGLPRPAVLAAAYPSQVDSFNATGTSNLTASPLGLGATFAIHSVSGTLWSGGSVTTFPGPVIGMASFFLNYSELPDRSGVAIAWNVVGWPWSAPTDLLALELRFGLSPTAAIAPCAGAAGGPTAPSTCPGTSLGDPGIVWDPTITSVIATGATGASASLSWVRPVSAGAPDNSSLLVGTYAPSNTSAEVVLGSAATAASSVTGLLTFALFPPALPALPFVLHGDRTAYVAGLVVAGTVGAIGLGWYRRENRLAVAEL